MEKRKCERVADICCCCQGDGIGTTFAHIRFTYTLKTFTFLINKSNSKHGKVEELNEFSLMPTQLLIAANQYEARIAYIFIFISSRRMLDTGKL